MNIWSQKSALIQPISSRPKFADTYLPPPLPSSVPLCRRRAVDGVGAVAGTEEEAEEEEKDAPRGFRDGLGRDDEISN